MTVEVYIRLGYRQDELVGWAGLEAVYEVNLPGQRGGSFIILVGPDGEILSLLLPAISARTDVYTTLDKRFRNAYRNHWVI